MQRHLDWALALTALAALLVVAGCGGGTDEATATGGLEFTVNFPPLPDAAKLAVIYEATNSITIDSALTVPAVFGDDVIILGNELQSTSYTIRDAHVADARTIISFGDELYIMGMGAVTQTDNEADKITSDRDIAGYGRVEGNRHAGRWLYNEDKSRCFRIAEVGKSGFRLEGVDANLEDVFTDADGDGRRLYWISDIGPGDSYRIPTATYYSRSGALRSGGR